MSRNVWVLEVYGELAADKSFGVLFGIFLITYC